MEHQQKAEAYVREKLPELMELSFGCLLKDDTNTFTYLSPSDDGSDAQLIMHSDGGVTEHIHGFDLLENLGHPIQLQHWLRVITPQMQPITMDSNGIVTVWKAGEDGKTPVYESQFTFDLTTGQPATEADFANFCKIVGI
jgi:hypothetical protein